MIVNKYRAGIYDLGPSIHSLSVTPLLSGVAGGSFLTQVSMGARHGTASYV